MTRQLAEVTLTLEQRTAFLKLLADQPGIGHVRALRQVGVSGSKGQLHRLLENESHLIQDARDVVTTKVRETLLEMATDPAHPSCQRAAALWLKAYDPDFRELSRHELTGAGGGPVQVQALPMIDPTRLTEKQLDDLIELLEQGKPEPRPGELETGVG